MADLVKASQDTTLNLSRGEKEIQEPIYLKCLKKVMKPT